MKYEISASQLCEYTQNGVVAFAPFISENDIQILSHSPGIRDSFQKCPLTKKILSGRSLGKLLFEITKKRPIRLVMSKKIVQEEVFDLNSISIEEIFIGIYFSFENSETIFFNQHHIPTFNGKGMVAVYGDSRARYLKKEADLDSAYLLKKGYASGDKLHINEYPFIFK